MALPVNTSFTDQVTVISQPWIQGSNDWVNGAYGVLGATYTATAFRTAIGAVATGSSISVCGGVAPKNNPSETTYTTLYGNAIDPSSLSGTACIAPVAMVIDSLRLNELSTIFTAGTITVTLMVNSVATALTASYTFPTLTASDLVNSVSISAGQKVSFRLVSNASFTVISYIGFGARIQS